jgi:WD40 repeat protein
VGRRLQIWCTPSAPGTKSAGGLDFAPFILYRDLAGHFDAIQNIEWSSDSRFLLTASKDLTAKVWSLNPEDGFEPTTLAGHRQGVKAAYFTADQESVSATRMIIELQAQFVDRYTQSAKMVPFSSGNISLSQQIRTRRRRVQICVGG